MVLKYEKDIYPEAYLKTLVKIAHINHITGNNTVAIEYYKKVKISKTKDLLYQVFSGMGRCYSTMEEHTFAVEYLKKAIKLTKQKETNKYIKLTNGLGYSLIYLNKFEEAENIFNESLLLAKRTNNVEMVADTYYYQAVYEWFKNDFNKCIVKAKQNLKFTQKHKLLKEFAYTANLLSSSYQQKGDISQAQKYLDEAIEVFKTTKRNNALASALINHAIFYHWQGNFSKAKSLYENSLILAQQTDNRIAQFDSLFNLGSISYDSGKFDEAIEFHKKALEISSGEISPNYSLSMIYYKKGEIDKAKSILEKAIIKEKFPLYYIALTLINLVSGNKEYAEKTLLKALSINKITYLTFYTKTELYLGTLQSYYEMCNFEKSLFYAEKLKEIAPQSSKEHIIASAFIKINNYKLNKTSKLDITKQVSALKNMGCIYDYAYLLKLSLESIIEAGIEQENIKDILEQLNTISEIFKALGAGLELNRVKKIQEKMFPIIVKDYSRRTISTQYLETFSNLAELISIHLGDEDFIQNTLDLIIKATNAERGALFIKTIKGIDRKSVV